MDRTLVKTNFIGKDGFRWWIGQIAPDEVQAAQTKGVAKTGGRYSKDGPPPFGNRYKVRIMGYHPYNQQLKDEDLPWATVISPPGYGTGSAGLFKTVRFQQGDTVLGFFMDGDNAQIPMILGAFGNSPQKASEGAPLPFQSFTGYTSTLKKPSEGTLAESNSTGARDPQSPKNISPSDAKKVAEQTGNKNKAFINSAVGKVIHLGSGESKMTEAVNKMKTGVEGFTQELDNLKAGGLDMTSSFGQDKLKGLIGDKASALAGVGSGIVGGMTNGLYEKMGPMLNTGLSSMYDDVYQKIFLATQSPAMANMAGTAAQASMLSPIGDLEGLLPCLTNKITNNLTNSLSSILQSVADNVFAYADCVGDQATGAIMNDVIGQISEGMEGALGGISKLMKYMGDFSVEGLLRNGVDALLGMAGMGDCGVTPSPHTGAAKYRVGFGPIVQDAPDLSAIIKDANVAKAVSDAAALAGVPLDGVQDVLGGFSLFSGGISNIPSALSSGGEGMRGCSSALPTLCEPPKINIFGGGGRDAEAIPFYGNIMGDTRKTGSIIGIKMTNPGNGYLYPPFVEIVDNCKQGYGAVARATIKDGKVNEIYIVSEGENYPIEDSTPPIISDVTIINPGSGYEKGDTVTDDFDNEYDVKISSGAIVKITPINSKDITDIPTLTVKSTTGSGALLKANLDIRPEFQGEVKQVIDCPET